jgi:acyl phosphate:glycerol-3-phosphate acyltransferase
MEELVDALRGILGDPHAIGLLVAGYLAGSVPFGLILARTVAGKDVRAAGSGNIGATNVARVVGKKLGLVTLVLDVLKGFLPVLAASFVALGAGAAPHRFFLEGLVGLAALLGHCFPVWLKLRGGKGVATGLGVLLAHRPEVAAVGLVAFGLGYALVRRVSAGSVVAALAVVLALAVRGPHGATLLPIGLCALIILGKHHGNIRRLLQGRELTV